MNLGKLLKAFDEIRAKHPDFKYRITIDSKMIAEAGFDDDDTRKA